MCEAILMSPARAELHFPQPTVSLGKIKSGIPVQQEFSFVNRGKEPVEILELRPGCGCVVPELKQKKILPGEEGKIALKVHTLGEAAGTHRWYVYVFYSGGGEQHQVALQVLADLVTEVSVQPGKLRIHATGPVSQEICVRDVRAKPLSITEIRTSDKFVQAALGMPFHDDAGNWSVKIKLTLSEDCPEGKREEQLNIYTSDPLYRHLQVPLVITREKSGSFKAIPSEVKWFVAAEQAIPARLVVIQNASGEEVLVEKIWADHPAIQYRWARGPGPMATVKIQLDRAQIKTERLESSVHVQLKGGVLTIPVSCHLE